ncbi:MAG: L-histidine N(alpha)-methyltransferase [Rhizomicrobium sp.]
MSSAAIAYKDYLHFEPHVEFENALTTGLRKTPKELPCKFFYDAIGSALFDRICELPEYYPTRTETALLQRYAGEFADLIGPNADLVEFGAGSLQKVGYLLDALNAPKTYIPIDISGEYLEERTAHLRHSYPSLAVRPVIADFTKPVALPSLDSHRVGFFSRIDHRQFHTHRSARFPGTCCETASWRWSFDRRRSRKGP